MAPVKGLATLLDAWARLGAVSEARVFLVGDGPQRAALQAQARRLGLESRVHFVGTKAQDELGDWYRAADLTVLPSLSEGIPNVLLESLACGTPFLATDVGGVREICANPQRDLVPAGDASALALALERRLRDPGAATTPPGFSPADSAAVISEVLRSVVAAHRRLRQPATC
jgi:glycosyltransferase involved in cell wall biosynthesis